jgi:hypothetical protein
MVTHHMPYPDLALVSNWFGWRACYVGKECQQIRAQAAAMREVRRTDAAPSQNITIWRAA